jgi:hypothetical protein
MNLKKENKRIPKTQLEGGYHEQVSNISAKKEDNQTERVRREISADIFSLFPFAFLFLSLRVDYEIT